MGGETGADSCKGLAAVVRASTMRRPGERGGTVHGAGGMMLGCEGGKGSAAEIVRRRWMGGGTARQGDGETERMMGAGQIALASGGAERCTSETAAGMTERPGGGRGNRTFRVSKRVASSESLRTKPGTQFPARAGTETAAASRSRRAAEAPRSKRAHPASSRASAPTANRSRS